jgi:hypothetical protein
MKEMGVVLVVVGLQSLLFGGISRIRNLSFPPALGWIALVGGIVLLARR